MGTVLDTKPLSRSAKGGTMRWNLSNEMSLSGFVKGYLLQGFWPNLSYSYVAIYLSKIADGSYSLSVHPAGDWSADAAASTDISGVLASGPSPLFTLAFSKENDEVATTSLERVVGNVMHAEFLPNSQTDVERILAI